MNFRAKNLPQTKHIFSDMIISGLLMASGLFRAILLIIASSQICRTKTKERIRVEPRLSVNTSTSREAGAVY